MAGGSLSDVTRWFEEQSAGAPPELRARAARFVFETDRGSADPASALGVAARAALARALERGNDRSAALDLLAADALLTLALLARAELDAAGLAAFAAEQRAAGVVAR
ncbi:MAG: hypothetical protein ACRENB_09115 [Gemmatimonadales bacterium]